MNKALKQVFCMVGIIISICIICITIGYEKRKINYSELVLYEEIGENINVSLTPIETTIIFASLFIFTVLLINIIFTFFKIGLIKKHYYILFIISIPLSVLFTFFICIFVNKNILVVKSENIIVPSEQSAIIKHYGEIEIEKDSEINYKNFYTEKIDFSTVLIKNASSVLFNGVSIKKYGDTSDLFSSKLYGINSGILVLKDSKVNIRNSTIDTYSKGSNGLFSTLENSYITGDMLIINTIGRESSGISSALGGNVTINNSKIKTTSQLSPAISSMRGGTIDVSSSIINTSAQGSPLIRASGIVSLNTSVGDANSAGFIYIDGKSTVRINNSELKSSANKYSNKDIDGGIVINQLFLNNKLDEFTLLEIKNSKLEIKNQSKVYSSAPLFNIVNSNTTINLLNSEFIYGSNILINASNRDNKETKDMIIVLNSDNEELAGDINLGQMITLELNYTNTTYTGKINENNNAKKVTLNLSSDSKIILTGDCYISVLRDEIDDYSNIDSKGYNIYYDKKLNKNLNGKKIKLINGGFLQPQ